MFPPNIIQPGDAIMYRPSSLVGVIIAIKTWSWTSHIEVYVGDNRSIGAREEGVDVWPVRNDKYAKTILRPKSEILNIAAGMEWFNEEAKGDKYDVEGLFGFFIPDKRPKDDSTVNYKKEFCSQLATMFYKRCGFNPFAPTYPARLISPAQYYQSPLMDVVWEG